MCKNFILIGKFLKSIDFLLLINLASLMAIYNFLIYITTISLYVNFYFSLFIKILINLFFIFCFICLF